MKMRILAASAAALLCTTGAAMAQPAGNAPIVDNPICSDVLAMEVTTQTPFLRGYVAGHFDGLRGAAAGMGELAVPSPAEAAPAARAAAAPNAAGVPGQASGGPPTVASVLAACASAPDSTLSQVMQDIDLAAQPR